MANPQPPPHASLHASPAGDPGNLTGTGDSSGDLCGETPGRYPHISKIFSFSSSRSSSIGSPPSLSSPPPFISAHQITPPGAAPGSKYSPPILLVPFHLFLLRPFNRRRLQLSSHSGAPLVSQKSQNRALRERERERGRALISPLPPEGRRAQKGSQMHPARTIRVEHQTPRRTAHARSFTRGMRMTSSATQLLVATSSIEASGNITLGAPPSRQRGIPDEKPTASGPPRGNRGPAALRLVFTSRRPSNRIRHGPVGPAGNPNRNSALRGITSKIRRRRLCQGGRRLGLL